MVGTCGSMSTAQEPASRPAAIRHMVPRHADQEPQRACPPVTGARHESRTLRPIQALTS